MRKLDQSVLDALADAETLRKVTRSEYRGYAYKGTDVFLAGVCAEAELSAALAPDSKYVGDFWIRLAAQHAFLACPGLRGE